MTEAQGITREELDADIDLITSLCMENYQAGKDGGESEAFDRIVAALSREEKENAKSRSLLKRANELSVYAAQAFKLQESLALQKEATNLAGDISAFLKSKGGA